MTRASIPNPSPACRGLACIDRSLRINPYLLISLLNIRPSGLVSGTKLPDLCSSSSTTHLSLSSDIVSLFQQAQFPFSWSQLCQFNLESNPPAFAIDSDFLLHSELSTFQRLSAQPPGGCPALPGDIYETKQRSMESQQSGIGNGRMLSLTQSPMRAYHLCGHHVLNN